MENIISILWEELGIFLKDDKDFQIVQIKDDSIVIKALNKKTFHIRWIYCKILSAIMPSNCTLEIDSFFEQSNNIKDDYFLFYLTIRTEKCFYEGTIKIIK